MASQSPDPRGKMSMTESMSKLCLSDKFADVTFVFGSKKLSAHRVVLSMRSPVFEAMLYGPLSETPGCEIRIEDTDLETFRLFLWFIYTDDISLDGGSVLKILYLANKYNLDILEDKCSTFLKTSINVDNVCIIYEHAGTFGQQELRRSCFEFITDHGAEVLCSHNFLAISKDTLTAILSSDDMSIDENLIFDAAIRWAKQQCRKGKVAENGPNIRHHLGNVLYSIRFPLIPMEVFAKEICPSQVLTNEEENVLSRCIATAGDKTSSTPTMVGSFIAKRRNAKYVHVTIEDSNNPAKNRTSNQRRGRGGVCGANVFPSGYAVNINEAHINITQLNRKNLKLHSIKCKWQFSVANVKRMQTSCSGRSNRSDAANNIPMMSDESKDSDEYEQMLPVDQHDLDVRIRPATNTVVLQTPLAVEEGTNISVYFTNMVRADSSKSVTHFNENGLDLQIWAHGSLFDELTFLQ